jgi:hypothetical protein
MRHTRERNPSTPWLIAAVGVSSATSIGCAVAVRRAHRQLPQGRSDGDWLDDLAQLVDQVFSARTLDLRGPIALPRRHVVAFAAAASLLGGLAMTGAQAIGEGWTDPVPIGTGRLLAFCLVSGAAPHTTVPRRNRGPAWVVAVATSVGLPASAVPRGDIYGVLGAARRGGHPGSAGAGQRGWGAGGRGGRARAQPAARARCTSRRVTAR